MVVVLVVVIVVVVVVFLHSYGRKGDMRILLYYMYS